MSKYVFDKKIFGNRIKAARKKQNLTQEELSNLLNINVTTLAKCESPNVKLTLSYSNLIALVNELNISIDYLFRTEEAEERYIENKEKFNDLVQELTEKERKITLSLIHSLIENRC